MLQIHNHYSKSTVDSFFCISLLYLVRGVSDADMAKGELPAAATAWDVISCLRLLRELNTNGTYALLDIL